MLKTVSVTLLLLVAGVLRSQGDLPVKALSYKRRALPIHNVTLSACLAAQGGAAAVDEVVLEEKLEDVRTTVVRAEFDRKFEVLPKEVVPIMVAKLRAADRDGREENYDKRLQWFSMLVMKLSKVESELAPTSRVAAIGALLEACESSERRNNMRETQFRVGVLATSDLKDPRIAAFVRKYENSSDPVLRHTARNFKS